MLAALDEKNAIYEEVSENTKVMQDLNSQIAQNADKIAQLRQDLEFSKAEFEIKADDGGDVYNGQVLDLKQEIQEKQDLIAQLKRTLKDKEVQERAVDQQIEESDELIKELEEEMGHRRSSVQDIG